MSRFWEDPCSAEVFISRRLAALRLRLIVPSKVHIWAEISLLTLLDRSKPKRICFVFRVTCSMRGLYHRLAWLILSTFLGSRWLSGPTSSRVILLCGLLVTSLLGLLESPQEYQMAGCEWLSVRVRVHEGTQIAYAIPIIMLRMSWMRQQRHGVDKQNLVDLVRLWTCRYHNLHS